MIPDQSDQHSKQQSSPIHQCLIPQNPLKTGEPKQSIPVISISDDQGQVQNWEAVEKEYELMFSQNPFGRGGSNALGKHDKKRNKKKDWKNGKYHEQSSSTKVYPIDHYPLNRLVPVGTKRGQLLCKIKEVFIQPSPEVKQKQKKANFQYNAGKQRSSSKDNIKVTQLKQPEESLKGKPIQISSKAMERFYNKRYYFFSNFDQGIQLDTESWFSVTPEAVAKHISELFSDQDTVMDGFCGAGGDSIQLAKKCKKVIANDIDPEKIALIKHNAKICKVQHKITFENMDFLQIHLKKEINNDSTDMLDCVYLSPPWGGTEYYEDHCLSPQVLDPPLTKIIEHSLKMSSNLVMLLPINIDVDAIAESIVQLHRNSQQFKALSFRASFSIEKIYFLGRLKFLLVLFGEKVAKVDISQELSYFYQMISQDEIDLTAHKSLIRVLRQKIGAPLVLNLLFQCERIIVPGSFCDKFKNLLIKKGIIKIDEMKQIESIEDDSSEEKGRKSKQIALLEKKQKKKLEDQDGQLREEDEVEDKFSQ